MRGLGERKWCRRLTDWRDIERARGRRPIEPDELPFLLALGDELRRMREMMGLSRPALAWASGVSERTVLNIEHATRRTRHTTLHALAVGLADSDDADADGITARFVELAGPTLAPSNRFSDRREHNRSRRQARADRLAATALPIAEKVAESMIQKMLVGYRLVPLPRRDRTKTSRFDELRPPAATTRARRKRQ